MTQIEMLKGSKVIIIRNKSDYIKFKNSNEHCIIFYSSKICPSCESILDFYIRIANKYPHKIAMAYVDISQIGLDFSTVPVFTALYRGEEIGNLIGADKKALKSLIKKAICAK